MDLKKIKSAAKIMADAGGHIMTMSTADVADLVALVERQEEELRGARFAADSHLNTVKVQAAVIAGAPGCAGLAIKDSVLPVRDAHAELRRFQDGISILRGALVNAECAIKGREHTGFITKALLATDALTAPIAAQAPASGAPDLPKLAEAVQKLLDRLDPFDYPDERNAIAAVLAQAAPASPAMSDDPLFDASSLLLRTAQDFWNAAKQARQYGAVQWVSGDDGALLIYTRGEYREQLMANIDKLGQAPHVFATPASPASAPVAPPVTPKHIEEIKDLLLWPVTEDDARAARDMLQSLHFDLSMSQDAAPLPPVVARKVLEEIPDGPAYGIIDPDYARYYSIIRCTAWQYGYAIGMHGSFTRDLDLIAVPWSDEARDPDHLVRVIVSRTDLAIQHGSPGTKPHGRIAYTLTLPGFGDPRWIDLSIMPRLTAIDAARLPGTNGSGVGE